MHLSQALVPSGWVLELLEVFGRERPLVACVLVAIHNRLALATSEEDREQAADALVCMCLVV